MLEASLKLQIVSQVQAVFCSTAILTLSPTLSIFFFFSNIHTRDIVLVLKTVKRWYAKIP